MADALSYEDKKQVIPEILHSIVFEENIFKKLNAVDVVVNALEDDVAHQVNAKQFKQWLHKQFIDNDKFMRRLNLYSKMNDNVETALELFGSDYVTHPEFMYDEQFFSTINTLHKRINEFIGRLLKEFHASESIESHGEVGDID